MGDASFRGSWNASSRQPLQHLEETLDLTCSRCEETAAYFVGQVVVDPDAEGSCSLEDVTSFTGYFRCRFCDAGGPWTFPARTALVLLTLVERYSRRARRGLSAPLAFGRLQLFDGTQIRVSTEGEDHLRRKLGRDPRNGFLWSRLGNLYVSGGRKDLAKTAFLEAIGCDDHDVESRHNLGLILHEEGELRDAGSQMRHVLESAWRKKEDLPRELLAKLIRHAFLVYSEVTDSLGEGMEPLTIPTGSGGSADGGTREIDLGTEEGWDDFVALFLRERRPAMLGTPVEGEDDDEDEFDGEFEDSAGTDPIVPPAIARRMGWI